MTLGNHLLEGRAIPGEKLPRETACKVCVLVDSDATDLFLVLAGWEAACLTFDVA